MTGYTYAPYDPTPAPPAPPSRAMAGTALGLSFLFFIPVIPLVVSVVLAIVVLTRSGDGREHGKGMAIAALIIDGLVTVGLVVALALGMAAGIREAAELDETSRDDSGRVTEPGDLAVAKLRTGDCLNDPALADARAGEQVDAALAVEAVPCHEVHGAEVFHNFDLPGRNYPGENKVALAADRGCIAAFRDYVGFPWRKSALDVHYYFPQATGWRLLDDRHVTCLVSDPKGPTTGSLEGTRR